jgi:hypothetical protein
MLKYAHVILVAGLWMASAAPAAAQWGSGMFENKHRDFHRNNCWPDPFLRADRDSVTMPMKIMIANGWRAQTLINQHHFESDGRRLKPAGEERVRWILTSAPQQYRTIYLERGANPAVTSARAVAVQRYAMQYVPSGQLPVIVETNVSSEGTPGEWQQQIHSRLIANFPDPRRLKVTAAHPAAAAVAATDAGEICSPRIDRNATQYQACKGASDRHEQPAEQISVVVARRLRGAGLDLHRLRHPTQRHGPGTVAIQSAVEHDQQGQRHVQDRRRQGDRAGHAQTQARRSRRG